MPNDASFNFKKTSKNTFLAKDVGRFNGKIAYYKTVDNLSQVGVSASECTLNFASNTEKNRTQNFNFKFSSARSTT